MAQTTSEFTLLQCEHPCGVGSTQAEHFKRAVLRPPPSRFTVEFLPIQKSGSHNHGMHISPISSDRESSSSRNTVEYDIWRKWEDCLWFQDTLETEYRRSAREKKTRLAQGKGVKAFNGMYKQDMASSWESLPPGPAPNSVSQDIHDYLPRLTKKGTLFRASMSTIENRQREFRTLVDSLFSDDVPALLSEIRASTIVTDFFGLWRRDYDQLEKAPNKGPRTSVTSSVFSMYFSESSPTLHLPSGSPSAPNSPTRRKITSRRPRSSGSGGSSTTSSSQMTETSRFPPTSRSMKRLSDSSDDGSTLRKGETRRRALSNTSSDSSSIHSTGSSGSSDSGGTTSTAPGIVDDTPVNFGHNPQAPTERPSSILEVLPEEREMLAKTPDNYLEPPRRRVLQTSLTERKANRSWQVVGTPAPDATFETNEPTANPVVRESWQTTTSLDSTANDLLEGLGLALPSPIKEQKYRASLASISTFMTTDSAEAIMPREPMTPTTPSPTLERFSNPPRISTAITLSDFDMYSDIDDDSTSIIDSFPHPDSTESFGKPESRPETPTGDMGSPLPEPTTPTSPESPRSNRSSFGNRPASPAASTMSSAPTITTISSAATVTTATASSSSSSAATLSIKAAHNASIIMLRISRDTSFEDVRQRIYNKFVGQEGVPLSKEFAVALVVPSTPTTSPTKSPSSKRSRSASVSSADKMELHFIDEQLEWEQIVLARDSNKVTLRVLDTPKS